MSELLTVAETAARLGLSVSTILNTRGALGLTVAGRAAPVEGRGGRPAPLFLASDVQRIADERAEAKAAPRVPRIQTEAEANERMLKSVSESKSDSAQVAVADDLTPTPLEMACVWAAHLEGTLGPLSPFRDSPPPARYMKAWAAREAGKAEALAAAAAKPPRRRRTPTEILAAREAAA